MAVLILTEIPSHLIFLHTIKVKKIFIIYSNNIQTFQDAVCYTKHIRNAQRNNYPFTLFENPKILRKVPCVFDTGIFLCKRKDPVSSCLKTGSYFSLLYTIIHTLHFLAHRSNQKLRNSLLESLPCGSAQRIHPL